MAHQTRRRCEEEPGRKGGAQRRARSGTASPLLSVGLLYVPVVCGAMGLAEGSFAVAALGCLFFFLGLGVVRATAGEDAPDSQEAFIVAFCLRITVTFVAYYALTATYGLPFVGYSDDYTYDLEFVKVADGLREGGSLRASVPDTRHPGFLALGGTIAFVSSALGEYHTLIVRLFNCLLGALSVLLVRRLAHAVADRHVAKRATWLLVFLPDALFYSAILLRESVLLALVMLATVCMADLQKRTGWKASVVLGATLGVTWLFRTVLVLPLALGVVASTLTSRAVKVLGGERRRMFAAGLSLALWASATMPVLLIDRFQPGGSKFNEMILLQATQGRVHAFDNMESEERTQGSVAQALNKMTSGGIRQLIFTSLMYVMPFPPWKALDDDNPLAVLRFLSAILWWVLWPLSLAGLWRLAFERPTVVAVLAVPWLAIVAAAGGTFFNTRYRFPGIGLGVILAAAGVPYLRSSPAFRLFFWAVELCPFAAYGILRAIIA